MRLSGLFLYVPLLVACGGGGDGGMPPGPTPASVTVAISSADAMSSVGETRTLTATVRDASQTVIPAASVTWSTDNQAVATLSSTSGLTTTATAAGNGTATIRAQSGTVSQTQAVTVAQRLSTVASLPATFQVAVNGTQQITATIRAQSGTVSQTQAVTVAQRLSTVASLPATFQVAVNGTQQLTATAKDANGNAIAGVTGFGFSSSDVGRATVTTAGVVQGVSVGQATITTSLTRDGVTRTATSTANVSSIASTATVAATPGLAFDPADVDITSGGSVSWEFGSVAHNVFFDAVAGAPANITGQNQNTTIARTFATAGVFAYHCAIHPSMTGTVAVH
jgi:plastocyanin